MDKKGERRMMYAITAGAIGIVAIISAASWHTYTRDYEANSKLNTAIIKADTNRDGILQNSELASMLKSMGCSQPIPENSNPLLQASRYNCPTFVEYEKIATEGLSSRQQGITISFTEKDLDRYLSKN